MAVDAFELAQICVEQRIRSGERGCTVIVGAEWPNRTVGSDGSLRLRNQHARRKAERLVLVYVVDLERREAKPQRGLAAASEEIKYGPVGNDGLNLNVLRGGSNHALVEVHPAGLCSRRRNLDMQPTQPDFVQFVWMEDQIRPCADDRHAVQRGKRWYLHIAVPVKGDALGNVPGVRKIGSMVAFHLDLAAEGPLQQRMHLPIAEGPVSKHHSNAR